MKQRSALCTSKSSKECTHQHEARCPNCHRWVLSTCQVVTPLLSFGCFTERSNLSTQTQGFCMLTHSTGGPEEWILVGMVGQGVQILPWKFQPISSTFTPSKSHFSFLFGVPPTPGGLLLSILALKWVASTLNLCTQHCVPLSQLHIPRPNSTLTCFSTA